MLLTFSACLQALLLCLRLSMISLSALEPNANAEWNRTLVTFGRLLPFFGRFPPSNTSSGSEELRMSNVSGNARLLHLFWSAIPEKPGTDFLMCRTAMPMISF
jgi:hypothetical protein